MQNYVREFNKFTPRKIKAVYPITAIPMHRTLCQDLLFDLSSRSVSVGSFTFSNAYFYDFYKISDGVHWSNIFVLDGVGVLHKSVGTNQPLVRDRALYSFLYLDTGKAELFARALVTNPWLNDLCKQPLRLMSERVNAVMGSIKEIWNKEIYTPILEQVDSGFTPRGVWGIDYMFMWKTHVSTVNTHVNENLSLITLDEYIKYFSLVEEGAEVCHS